MNRREEIISPPFLFLFNSHKSVKIVTILLFFDTKKNPINPNKSTTK